MSFHCLGVVVDIFTSPLPLLTAVHLEQDVLAFGKFMMKAEVLSLDCSGPGKEAMQLIALCSLWFQLLSTHLCRRSVVLVIVAIIDRESGFYEFKFFFSLNLSILLNFKIPTVLF